MTAGGTSRRNPQRRAIVFVNQATGYITIDIINEFARVFDEVALITGSIRVQDIPLDPRVRVSNISRYERGSPRRKLRSWIVGTVQILWLLLTEYRRYEIFYITVPPFAYLLSWFLPQRFSLLVFDVYPDVLKIYDISEGNLIYRIWAHLNKRLFKRAYRIFTIGEGMAALLRGYTAGDNLQVIPLWTGLTKAAPLPKRQNEWLRRLGLQDKFIVMYSGNIGYTHNVDALVDIALKMSNDGDVRFLIVGRGERADHIRSIIEQKSISNITMLPFQPDDVLVQSLAAADLGVVVLDERTANVSVPSKIYNLEAVGVPLLCIASPESELKRHVEGHQNGCCFSAEELSSIIRFIREMRENPERRRALAENSREASRFYTMENAKRFARAYLSSDGDTAVRVFRPEGSACEG